MLIPSSLLRPNRIAFRFERIFRNEATETGYRKRGQRASCTRNPKAAECTAWEWGRLTRNVAIEPLTGTFAGGNCRIHQLRGS